MKNLPEGTKDMVGNRSSEYTFFRIGGIRDTYIAIRLDLAEALLRRRVAGLCLEAIEE